MSTNVANRVPYLRVSRSFPQDPQRMRIEINKAYVDIANAVNDRTISFFTTTRPILTGENWVISEAQRQEGFRKVFTFSSTTSINHGINLSNVERFVRGFGSYSDGTNWYGLIFGSNGAIPNQISFYLTSTQIVFVVDGGAPALSRGTIVLEWLSKP